MNKGRKSFIPKQYFHTKKKEFNNMGHYSREFHANENNQIMFHPSTIVEEESSQKNTHEDKETRRMYYLVSTLSVSTITCGYTWLTERGLSKHMSGYRV